LYNTSSAIVTNRVDDVDLQEYRDKNEPLLAKTDLEGVYRSDPNKSVDGIFNSNKKQANGGSFVGSQKNRKNSLHGVDMLRNLDTRRKSGSLEGVGSFNSKGAEHSN
jgi:hypothetical protein